MKKRIAVAFHAVVLLAALYVLFGMRHFDADRFADDIAEHEDLFIDAVPVLTVPDGHRVNTHKS
jgi:hypothetical protein